MICSIFNGCSYLGTDYGVERKYILFVFDCLRDGMTTVVDGSDFIKIV